MSETTGDAHPDGSRKRVTSWQIRQWWRKNQWLAIGWLWLAAGILGFVGFARYFAALGQSRSFGDLLYLTIQLFVLESGAVEGPAGLELQIARFLAPAVAASTAVLALALLFYERFQLLRLRWIHDHVIICGLGYKGLVLAHGFHERGDRVVVIDRDEDNDLIDPCRKLGITVLIGDAASQEFLALARVDRAQYLFAVSGDDGANADVAVRAHAHVSKQSGPTLNCFVHIVDPRLCDLLRKHGPATDKDNRFTLQFFNVYDTGARAVLAQHPPFDRGPDGEPHLLVAGMGHMGESLIVLGAAKWRAQHGEANERLRISIIDRNAGELVKSLVLRHPQLTTACELVPLTMEIPSPDFVRGDFLFANDGGCDVTIAYVCLDDDTAALTTALALRQKVKEDGVPIVVRMRHDAGLATLLGGLHGDDSRFDGLHAFGLLDRTCRPELVLGGTRETP
ncbi:MAG: hypothetical protein GWN58_20910 [Anaerolineae bacterium]|nr:hypothetical protein [Anaerolineae bacterium]